MAKNMYGKSNKSVGNSFEDSFCEMLFRKGWWAHNMAQNNSGQPADVIAVKNGKTILVDCKDCKKRKFPLSRIEPNQHSAMSLFEMCSGSNDCYFALRLDDEVYMLSYDEALELGYHTTLTEEDIKSLKHFNKWEEDLCKL